MNYKIFDQLFLHKLKTFSSSEILDRLRGALGLANDTELANHLGIKKATLSNWRSRNSLDWPLLFSVCEQISLDWLVYERGDEQLYAQRTKEPNNDFINHLERSINAKDAKIGDLHEEIGRLKARIEELERERPVPIAPRYVHSTSKETVEP